MPKWGSGTKTVLLILGLVLPVLIIHYGLDRSGVWLVPTYAVAFAAYFMLYKLGSLNFYQLLSLAIFIRLLLFFGPPALSDDYYRFIWDGQVWEQGHNPYAHTPEQLIEVMPTDTDALFVSLNSPTYHSTYPPVSQYVFYLSAKLGAGNVFWSMTAIRVVLLLFEIGTLWLLFQLTNQVSKVIIYALNPLVVLELTGNLHFEGLVVFFLLLAWYFYKYDHWQKASVALSLGILAKLTPLMFLPVLFRKIGVKKALLSYVCIGVVLIVLSLPLIDLDVIRGLFNGLDLFFRKFEFNAGLFFLIREIGFQVMGYDVVQTVGPRLSLLAFALIIGYSLIKVNKRTDWAVAFTVVLFIQLLFATTVHPWYVIPLVAFSCMTGHLFPALWSLLAFFSYLGYSESGYAHPMGWIAFEYVAVFAVACYEILKSKPLLQKYV